jgi:hypothetical protein
MQAVFQVAHGRFALVEQFTQPNSRKCPAFFVFVSTRLDLKI